LNVYFYIAIEVGWFPAAPDNEHAGREQREPQANIYAIYEFLSGVFDLQ